MYIDKSNRKKECSKTCINTVQSFRFQNKENGQFEPGVFVSSKIGRMNRKTGSSEADTSIALQCSHTSVNLKSSCCGEDGGRTEKTEVGGDVRA